MQWGEKEGRRGKEKGGGGKRREEGVYLLQLLDSPPLPTHPPFLAPFPSSVGRSSVPITRYMSLNEDLSESYHDDVPVMAASAKPQATLAHQKEPSLLVAMAKSFWQPFLTAGLFKLLNDLLSFVNPFILK